MSGIDDPKLMLDVLKITQPDVCKLFGVLMLEIESLRNRVAALEREARQRSWPL